MGAAFVCFFSRFVCQEAKAAGERIQLEEELKRQRDHFEKLIAAKDTEFQKYELSLGLRVCGAACCCSREL